MPVLIALLLIFGLPLLGAAIGNPPVGRYLQFPPQTDFLTHAPFSWAAFVLGAILISAMVAPFIVAMASGSNRQAPTRMGKQRFPWWGWAGVLWLVLAWGLAWSRVGWFRPFQAYTYIPLWMGYIVVVNALAFQRSGRSLLTHNSSYLAKLFPLSALFWWSFEYLNRFIQNWHYLGIAGFDPVSYVIHASISFSTVLPAVMSTADWLRSFPGLRSRSETLWPVDLRHAKLTAGIVLGLGALAMLLMGVLPDYLFPLVWVAPLLVLLATETLAGKTTVLATLPGGNWSPIVLPAIAALICGFFWEMWNFRSLAHWEYTVPFVHRFQIFEMPLLGYGGYLPFGVECAVIADLIRRER